MQWPIARYRPIGIQDVGNYVPFDVICYVFIYRVVQKTDPLVYFDNNFGKYGPI